MLANLNVRIGADISNLTGQIKKAQGALTSFADKTKNIGRSLSVSVTTPLALLSVKAIKTAADFEDLRTSFEVMTGSAEEGAAVFERLREFAASTPFETAQLAKATQTMLSFGITTKDSAETLRMLGDVAMGNGQKLDTLTLAFSRIVSTGKATGQEINMMIDQGFNPLQIISEKTGKSMSVLKEEMARGAISADMIRDAFITATSKGGQFFGGMEKGSQTLSGVFSTFRDNVTGALAAIGEDLVKTFDLKNLVIDATKKIQELVTAFQNLSDKTKENIFKLLAVLAGIGPALIVVGTAIGVVAAAVALLTSPVTAVIVGIVALVGVLYYLLDNWNAVIERISDINWWRNTLISMLQATIKNNPFSLFIDGFILMARFVTGAFGDFSNYIIRLFLQVKSKVLGIVSDIVVKAAEGLDKIPFMTGIAEKAKEVGKALKDSAEDAKNLAESGQDLAGELNKNLQNLDDVNPFRKMANNLEGLKVEQGKYNNEFKSLGHYISNATQGLAEMLGLSELLQGTTAETTQETEAEDVTPKVDEGQITKTLTLFGRLRQDFARIKNDAELVKRAYISLGEGIADAFTRAIMTGKSLADQLKQLAGLLASKALQFALTTLLTGGLSIGGSETAGFLGQGGGLLGSLFKRLAGSAAPVPVGTQMIDMASSNLNGVNSDTSLMVASAFETALENYTSKLGPDEFFTLSQKGQYGF